MSTTSSSEEVTHPWIVTSDGIGPGQYSLRQWNDKLGAYTSYVTGYRSQMQTLCDAMNRIQELDAVETMPTLLSPARGEVGYVDPRHIGTEIAEEEPAMPWCYCYHCKVPTTRTPGEAHAVETIRQIKALIQSWDDMSLKSREAMAGIKHIIKEREE